MANSESNADRELGRAYAIASALAMVAEGELTHVFAGSCPRAGTSADRDPQCPACRALIEWDALKDDHSRPLYPN